MRKPDVDPLKQAAYEELRRRGAFKDNPLRQAAAQELIRRGGLVDVSGGTKYDAEKPANGPIDYDPDADVPGAASFVNAIKPAYQGLLVSKQLPSSGEALKQTGQIMATASNIPQTLRDIEMLSARTGPQGDFFGLRKQNEYEKGTMQRNLTEAEKRYAPYLTDADTAMGAGARASGNAMTPSAAAFSGFSAGATAAGRLPIPNPLVKGLVTTGAGMIGGGIAAFGAQKAQDAARKAIQPDALFTREQAQLRADAKQFPTAVALGGNLPSILMGKPTADDIRALPGLIRAARNNPVMKQAFREALQSESGRKFLAAAADRAMESGLEVVAGVGQSLAMGQPINKQDILIGAIVGALFPGENALGRVFTGAGARAGNMAVDGAAKGVRGVQNAQAQRRVDALGPAVGGPNEGQVYQRPAVQGRTLAGSRPSGVAPSGVQFTPIRGRVGKVTNYATADDRTPDSNSKRGIGAFPHSSKPGSMIPGVSAAIKNSDLGKQLRADGIKPGDYFAVQLSNGQTQTFRWDDTIPEHGSGSLDVYNPNGRERDFALNDAQIVGFAKVSGSAGGQTLAAPPNFRGKGGRRGGAPLLLGGTQNAAQETPQGDSMGFGPQAAQIALDTAEYYRNRKPLPGERTAADVQRTTAEQAEESKRVRDASESRMLEAIRKARELSAESEPAPAKPARAPRTRRASQVAETVQETPAVEAPATVEASQERPPIWTIAEPRRERRQIAEISGLQASRTSQRQLDRLNSRADKAMGTVSEGLSSYQKSVIEAYDNGTITENTKGLHPDAAAVIRWHKANQENQSRESSAVDIGEWNNIKPSEVQAGMTVFTGMGPDPYTVAKVNSNSVTLKRADGSQFRVKQDDLNRMRWSDRQKAQASIREGKPVPPEVLADYPDLAAKYKAPTEAPQAQRAKGEEVMPAPAATPAQPAPKPIPVDSLKRIIAKSPTPDLEAHTKEVVQEYSHLLQGVGSKREVTPAEFAQRIAEAYDLSNPRNMVAYSVVSALSPDTVIKATNESVVIRGRNRGQSVGATITSSPAARTYTTEQASAKLGYKTATEFLRSHRDGKYPGIPKGEAGKWDADAVDAAMKSEKDTRQKNPFVGTPKAAPEAKAQVVSEAVKGTGWGTPEQQAKEKQARDAREAEISDRVEASKLDNWHLDDAAKYGDPLWLRGKTVVSLRDGSRGKVRTVDNSGSPLVYWADEASANNNLGTPITERRNGKAVEGFQTLLVNPRDASEFVIEGTRNKPPISDGHARLREALRIRRKSAPSKESAPTAPETTPAPANPSPNPTTAAFYRTKPMAQYGPDSDKMIREEIQAKKLTISGHEEKDLAIFKNPDTGKWDILEQRTGLSIVPQVAYRSKNPTRADVIEATKKFLDEISPEKFNDAIESRIKAIGPTPRYAADAKSEEQPTARENLVAKKAAAQSKLNSRVKASGTRLNSSTGVPDPGVIAAAAEFLAYDAAIRAIDVATALKEYTAKATGEVKEFLTTHRAAIIKAAEEFKKREIDSKQKTETPPTQKAEGVNPEANRRGAYTQSITEAKLAAPARRPRRGAQETPAPTEQPTAENAPVASQKPQPAPQAPRQEESAPPPPESPKDAPKESKPAENPNARKLLKIAVQQEIAQELGVEDWTERSALRRGWQQTFAAASENYDAFASAVRSRLAAGQTISSDEERIIAAQMQKDARQKVRELLDSGVTGPELDGAIAEVAALGRAITVAGSEAGRSLALGRALVDDGPGGFMKALTRAEKASEGKLSAQARRDLAVIAREGEKIQEAIDQDRAARAKEAEAYYKARRRTSTTRTAPASKAGEGGTPNSGDYGTKNTVFTKERYEAAKARLDKAASVPGAGSFGAPLSKTDTLFRDLVTVGGYHFEAGLRKFGDWAAQMRTETTRPLSDRELGMVWNETVSKSRRFLTDAEVQAAAKSKLDALKDIAGTTPKSRQKQVNPLLDIAVEEYAKRAQTAEQWAKSVERRTGLTLPLETRRKLYEQAAAEFAKESVPIEATKRRMAALAEREVMKTRPLPMRALNTMVEISGSLRSIVTSIDYSGWMNQGGILVVARPKLSAGSEGALAQMFKAGAREEVAEAVNGAIMSRQESRYGSKTFFKDIGLELSEIGDDAKLTAREEGFAKGFAEKIPFLGRGVRGSERAYATVLNVLRADTFDAMYEPGMTLEEAKDIARYINVASGRGDIHESFSGAAAAAAHVLFSPRYMVSRVQYLIGQPLFKASSAKTRKLIAKEYARYLYKIALYVALGMMSGLIKKDLPEKDADGKKLNPVQRIIYGMTSTDTGMARVRVPGTGGGELNLDPYSALKQYVVFANTLLTGQRVPSDKQPMNEEQRKEGMYKVSPGETLSRFARSKLAPVPAQAWTWGIPDRNGEKTDFIGRPASVGQSAMQLILPMSANEIINGFSEMGVAPAEANKLMIGLGIVGSAALSSFGLRASYRNRNVEQAQREKFKQERKARKEGSAALEYARSLSPEDLVKPENAYYRQLIKN